MRLAKIGIGDLVFGSVALLFLLLPMRSAAAADEITLKAEIGGDAQHTRFVAFVSKRVDFRIFSIGDPYRIVIDLPEAEIQVPAERRGLILASRSGKLAEGKSRIVIDLAAPALVEKSEMLAPENGLPARLIVELVKSTHKAFAGQSRAAPPLPPEKPAQAAAPKDPADKRPLIVVDPGHGGVDAGARGRLSATPEKEVTLDFCKTLKQKLDAMGKYRVIATRSEDVFVALDDRAHEAARQTADLLISVHADALDPKRLGIKGVQEVRGGTIYTLSEEASDEQAKLLAQNENKADLQAGVGSEQTVQPTVSAEITGILSDLESRGKKNRSLALANYLIEHLQDRMKFNVRPQRSANLRVLKAAGVPAVLIELGYLSNSDDEKLLTSPEWREQIASAVASAVNNFMSERLSHIPL